MIETPRPIILVDLDSVVYDWVHIAATIMYEVGVTDLHPRELLDLYRSWEVWEDWGIEKGAFFYWWKRAIEKGDMYGKGKDIDGARNGLWSLSDAEWHIHIVTARLNMFGLHHSVVQNTAEWLMLAGIPYRSLSFTEDKHLIYGDAIIDDQAANLVDHPAPTRYLFPGNHNLKDRTGPLVDEGQYTVLDVDDPWEQIVEELT